MAGSEKRAAGSKGMTGAPGQVRIATRRSRLALWQAEHVKERLEALYRAPDALHGGLRVSLVPLSTRGDELLEVSLAKEGGKGLFVKELETALAEGRAEIAVHSMKDVPADLPPGFALAAILEREDPRDAFVSPAYQNLAALPARAVVGTSSLRRQAQIAARHPGLEIRPLRGNVDTRIAKLDRGEYAAIVLAAAGLKRLGLAGRIRSHLSVEESLPAAGQAALGVECLAARADLLKILAPLNDANSSACVLAEREVNRALGGSCTIPLGAYAEIADGRMRLRALVASPDGKRSARAEGEGDPRAAEALGLRVADLLRERGAAEILAALAQ
jgi:hydroxymethylbilane synthase